MLIDGVEDVDIVHIGHVDDMHHRIGGSGEEKDLRLFDDCVGTFLAARRSVHWCDNPIRPTCAANPIHFIGSYRWRTEYIDQ